MQLFLWQAGSSSGYMARSVVGRGHLHSMKPAFIGAATNGLHYRAFMTAEMK